MALGLPVGVAVGADSPMLLLLLAAACCCVLLLAAAASRCVLFLGATYRLCVNVPAAAANEQAQTLAQSAGVWVRALAVGGGAGMGADIATQC